MCSLNANIETIQPPINSIPPIEFVRERSKMLSETIRQSFIICLLFHIVNSNCEAIANTAGVI